MLLVRKGLLLVLVLVLVLWLQLLGVCSMGCLRRRENESLRLRGGRLIELCDTAC